MTERLAEQIRLFSEIHRDSPVAEAFMRRLKKDGGLTRDENPHTHFCVYFAAYDPKKAEVFIGHHKKSDLWLFNGGHIDAGETAEQALLREMSEEWGMEKELEEIGDPKLLTVTEINNPGKQACVKHYDIWYFVPVDRDGFAPTEDLLLKEFHSTDWLSVEKARELVTDPSTLTAISKFEEIFTNNDQK